MLTWISCKTFGISILGGLFRFKEQETRGLIREHLKEEGEARGGGSFSCFSSNSAETEGLFVIFVGVCLFGVNRKESATAIKRRGSGVMGKGVKVRMREGRQIGSEVKGIQLCLYVLLLLTWSRWGRILVKSLNPCLVLVRIF